MDNLLFLLFSRQKKSFRRPERKIPEQAPKKKGCKIFRGGKGKR